MQILISKQKGSQTFKAARSASTWNWILRFGISFGFAVGYLTVDRLHAATNPALLPSRISGRTNAPATLGKTNVVAKQRLGSKTNAVAVAQNPLLKAKAEALDSFNRLKGTKAYYPVIIGVPVCLLLAVFFLAGSIKSRKKMETQVAADLSLTSVAARPTKKLAKVHSCNVLDVRPEARHLWKFEAQNGGFSLNRQQTSLAGEPLPGRIVGRDWHSLWQRKLNIAWLPPEQVFLRVAQFPRSDFSETLAMVELQLEKLSPMPVAQIVWAIQVLPHAEETLQTVVLMIVARNVVEEFLGQLEGQGYLADRLELPLLDQLQATAVDEDGAWIYPQTRDGKNTALVAWWYGGVLQNVDLVTLPATPQSSSLKEQLLQMAWAGEMEGWLKSSPGWHLVAEGQTAGQWEAALRESLEQPIAVLSPIPAADLAGLTAQRAASSDPRSNLLPLEFSTRYQQQFVDRLWMRGLLAVLGLYLLGVAVYGVALGVATFRTRTVENRVAQLGVGYTNAMQLKARYQVLKDRQELKYAALDCWNLVARFLPDSATLDTLNFVDGKRLTLNGTSPLDKRNEVIEFESEMRKATNPTNGDLVFDPSKGEHFNYQVQGGNSARWNFTLELKRAEVE